MCVIRSGESRTLLGMSPEEQLMSLPSVDLRGFVSPVQLLSRLSDEIGVEVWCKRDDIGSVGLAGNKVRKIEMELAHARSTGATHLVTEGSRLSNAARAVAAAAATAGMKCTLVLCHDEPREPVGNLMLDGLFGADIRFVGDLAWTELAQRTAEVVDELRAQGERVYRLPIGCATSRGATGFARAFIEASDQMTRQGAELRTLVHASSAGSTHAGLTVGRVVRGSSARIIGVVVAENVYEDVPGTYVELARGAMELIGCSDAVTRDDVELDTSYIGEGYGRPAPGVMEAIDLMARLEGIVVDPVYSAKAAAALIDMARKGAIEGPVLFWHTGGYHALFDPKYTDAIWSEVPRLRAIKY